MIHSANLYKMKSTVSYYGMLEKPSCCRILNTKYLALLSGIYTLVSINIEGTFVNIGLKDELATLWLSYEFLKKKMTNFSFSVSILSIKKFPPHGEKISEKH